MRSDGTLPLLDRDALLSGVRRLPSLPTVIVELLHSIEDDTADPRQLARQLMRDQALAAKVLRVANSSFYGFQGKIETIADAFLVLGLQGVRTLAVGAALTSAFAARQLDLSGTWNFDTAWRHSTAVALAAKSLAQRSGASEGLAFVAGLLHDIGRLVLVSSFPQHTRAVIRAAACSAQETGWLCAEQRTLGTDHAAIGQLLAEHWRFPRVLSEAIGTHHTPDVSAGGLAPLIHVADLLGHAVEKARKQPGRFATPPCDDDSWTSFRLGSDDWNLLAQGVSVQLDAACAALVA